MTNRNLEKSKPGDIWWVKLTIQSSDTVGHETQKNRPCLVVANNPKTQLITIIPFQSNLDAINLPYTYLIKKHQNNGLKQDSVAVIFQLRSLSYIRFQNFCGTIKPSDLRKIKDLIKDYLQL